MIKEIGPGENGFGNSGYDMSYEDFQEYLTKNTTEALLTCNEDNAPSRKVIEANNGDLEDSVEGKCRYWIRNLINHNNLKLEEER